MIPALLKRTLREGKSRVSWAATAAMLAGSSTSRTTE